MLDNTPELEDNGIICVLMTRSMKRAQEEAKEMEAEVMEAQKPGNPTSIPEADEPVPIDPIIEVDETNCTEEIVDIEDRGSILWTYHDSTLGGHRGMNKTCDSIRKVFYWEGMKKDIEDYVRKCDICQKKKHRRPLKMPLKLTEIANEPFINYGGKDHLG